MQCRNPHEVQSLFDCKVVFCAILVLMHNKHRKTFHEIYSDPINGNIEWRKIETLFLALGAEKDEGNGSAVTFILNNKRVDFHRPHPNKEALRYRIKIAREFLEKAGITL